MSAWIFWLSAAGVVYAYAGYPLLVWLLAEPLPGVPAEAGVGDGELPDVTSSCRCTTNAATIVEPSWRTPGPLIYPASAWKAVFVSDGSTDGTAEIIEAAQDERIELYILSERGGKAGALNAGLARRADAHRRLLGRVHHAGARLPSAPSSGPSRCLTSAACRARIGSRAAAAKGSTGSYEMFLRRQESRLIRLSVPAARSTRSGVSCAARSCRMSPRTSCRCCAPSRADSGPSANPGRSAS